MDTMIEEANLITEITDKLIDFMSNDPDIKDDYEDFTLTIGAKKLPREEIRSRTITYIFTRQLQNKSVFDIFLEKYKNLTKKEKETVNALKNVITGVFKIQKIHKNGFDLYNLINEKDYTAYVIGTMTSYRTAYPGSFLYCRLCKLNDKYYICDVRALTGADKTGGAQRYAVSKIIENPNNVFIDNPEKLKEIKEQIKNFNKKFKECFSTDEVVTTNKFADDLINAFNDYCESGNEAIKEIVSKGIEKPKNQGYFPTKDFHFSLDDFAKKSVAGFSATGETYDVALVYVEKSGMFAIPFYNTFCKIFETENYIEISNYEQCVENFLKNTKIPSVILEKVYKKYPAFPERISEIIGEKLTFEQIIQKYKPNTDKIPVIAPAAILYSSKVFADLMKSEIETEEMEKSQEEQVEKVGRNDPCPCGSGKKYKKCCMPKSNQN